MSKFKIISFNPCGYFDEKQRLPIEARFRCFCGKEHSAKTIHCDCEEYRHALALIGDGKKVEITLQGLSKKDVSIIKIERYENRQAVEAIFKDKNEDIVPCPTGDDWYYLRVRKPRLTRLGNDTGKVIVEYYWYKFNSQPTFDLKIGKKVYKGLPQEIIENILNTGEIPESVIKALKKGEVPILTE